MIQLIGNGTLITRNANKPLIKDGCVAVEKNKIVDYGITKDMKASHPGASFYDSKGGIIMPGLINAHGHIYSALARGMSLENPGVSKNFTQILENLWWRVDRALSTKEIEASAYVTYLDGIRNGVTTVFDHHASAGSVAGSLFTIADVARDIGIRTSLCYEVSDRDGKQISDAGIKENADFIGWAEDEQNDMIKAMFGLHASFTLSDVTLEKCVETAADCGFHIHVAEGIDDLNDSLEKYGMRVAERLDKFGILKPNTLAVHCIHVNENEIQLIKDSGSIVIHNPESNMGNAVGCADILKMMEEGILVGLGTDGYTTDMFESLKAANLIQKHVKGDPSVAWSEPPNMLFQNNSEICARFFNNRIGVIEKDALADIIVLEYFSPTPITQDNIDSHMHFGLCGKSVISTMVDGKFIMKDRAMQDIDEQKIYADSRQTAEEFWNRA